MLWGIEPKPTAKGFCEIQLMFPQAQPQAFLFLIIFVFSSKEFHGLNLAMNMPYKSTLALLSE